MSFDASQPTDHETAPGLRTPADLVAAVPYLLGFHPTDSLVLVSTRTGGQPGVEFTLRVDLPPPRAVADLARELAGAVRAQRCDELLLVVVGGGAPVPEARRESRAGHHLALDPPRAEVVAAVVGACTQAGVLTRAAIWVAEVAAGTPWRCYGECGCVGALPDPTCSPAAAAAVAAGQVTYADRTELEQLVAPAPRRVLRRRSALLNRRLDELCDAGDAVPSSGPQVLRALDRWIDVAAADRPQLADEDVVDLCLALSDPLVRDAAFGFAFDSRAAGAERLWMTLVTEAPAPESAEAAVLLAHSALMRADGALAGIALARAQEIWPGHRLSAMIRSALEAGIGPDRLRDWFVEGSQRATELLDRRAEQW
jgi:Domain of unknown function (DUF4192)